MDLQSSIFDYVVDRDMGIVDNICIIDNTCVIVECDYNSNSCDFLGDTFTNHPLIHDDSLRLDSDNSVGDATKRIFKKGDVYSLSRLKELIQLFVIKWIFVVVRMSFNLFCNRADKYGPKYNKKLKRKTSIIQYNYGWCVKFHFVDRVHTLNSSLVVLTSIVGKHYNTYDPTSIDQFVRQMNYGGSL